VQTLSDNQLLAVWEQGFRLHPVDRGLLVLSAALPGVPYAALADWPLGRRNRALAEWLCTSFGPRLAGWATCERCGERLEFELDTRVLLAAEPTDSEARVEVGGHMFRLPTSRDLALAARAEGPHDAMASLLDACRLDAGEKLDLSGEQLDELGERLSLADPLAETHVAMTCPECAAQQDDTLNMTVFAWAELEARIKRLLLEVHLLASAYGWSEADVLAVSEPRRAFYLDAAGR